MRSEKRDAGTAAVSRRDFMIRTAAGAGMLLSANALAQTPAEPKPADVAAVQSSNVSDVNVAIVGAGIQGRELIECLLRMPGIRIRAVCDLWDCSRKRTLHWLERCGQQPAAYEDYRDLLAREKDLDAAIVATPDFVHAEHAIACMKAGLHVYCETPLSHKLDDARRMITEARKTGKLLQAGLQRRSNPRYLHAVNTLLQERQILGPISQAYGQWCANDSHDIGWPKNYEMPPELLRKYGYKSMHHFRNWRWYKAYGGGPLFDKAIHQFDVFNWVFRGTPASVYASGGIIPGNKNECMDNAACFLEYNAGQGPCRVMYQLLSTNSYGEHYENVLGRHGALVISEAAGRGDCVVREPAAPDWEPLYEKGLLEQEVMQEVRLCKDAAVEIRVSKRPYNRVCHLPVTLNKRVCQPHLENFFDAIRNGVQLNAPAETAYKALVVADKICRSIHKKKTLRLRPEMFHIA